MIKKIPESGLWFVQVSARHPVTRQPKNRRRYNIQTEAEAKRVERQLERDMLKSFEEVLVPTWRKLLDEYFKFKLVSGEWNLKTIEDAKLTLEAHTLEAWGERKVNAISKKDIHELMVAKVGHRGEGTQKNFIKFVRGALSFAVEMQYLMVNPTPSLKFKLGAKVKNFLKEEEVKYFLLKAKEFDHPWYYHWCMAVYTGMRTGELFALTWDEVDIGNGIINVKYSWNKVMGIKATKNQEDRVVDIAPRLEEILTEIKTTYPDSHYVLPRLRDWEKGEQARILRTFLISLGLKPIRFHELRATWATMLLIKGIEPIKVMVMGGWKDLKTMQIYLRTAGVEVRGVNKVLDFT
jgi:integrase